MNERLEELYNDYWLRQNKIPLLAIYSLKNSAVLTAPYNATRYLLRNLFAKINWKIKSVNIQDHKWLDNDYVLRNYRFQRNSIFYGGAAFPVFNPNLGPDILGAICGCDIKFGKSGFNGTSWAIHNIKDFNNCPDIKFDENNIWWKRIYDLTVAAVNDSNGDYEVGITDLHPGTDSLVSLRGPEELCMDLFDCPEQVLKFNSQIFEVYKEVYNRLDEAIMKKQKGRTNWSQIYGKDKWYVVSSDFSGMLSRDHYEEFVVPGIKLETEFLDKSIYHLDGVGALHHLDRILQFDRINGVQWVPGVGKPPMREWIPTLKKIQDAGKNLFLNVEPEDVIPLTESLDKRGLYMNTYVITQRHAQQLIDYVESRK